MFLPNHQGQVKVGADGWLNYHMVSGGLGFVGRIQFRRTGFNADQFTQNDDPRFIDEHGCAAVLEEGDGTFLHEVQVPTEVYEEVIRVIVPDLERQRLEWQSSDRRRELTLTSEGMELIKKYNL